MRFRSLVSLALAPAALALASTGVSAQAPGSDSIASAHAAALRRIAAARAAALPDVRSSISLARGLAGADLTSDDATATVRLPFGTGLTKNGERTFALTLSGPLKKPQASSSVVDQTGLRGSASVGMSFAYTRFSPGDGVNPNALSAVCEKHLKRRSCNAAEFSEDHQKREFFSVASFRPPTSIGIAAQLGRQDLKFVDPADAELATQAYGRNTSSITAGVMRAIGSGRVLYALTYRYSRTFKAADAAQVCKPLSAPDNFACSILPLGVPGEQLGSALGLETRAFFASTAFAPKVGYDLRKEQFRLDVPIYLFRADGQGFAGGVTASLVEGEKRVGYSVFISRPLGTQFW